MPIEQKEYQEDYERTISELKKEPRSNEEVLKSYEAFRLEFSKHIETCSKSNYSGEQP